MTTVLAHGTFDLLHPGHVAHLKAARQLGGRLVVGLTADEFVKKGPGRPVFGVEDRRAMLRALECVNEVVVVHDRTALPVIDQVKPAVYVKGKDWETRQSDADFQAEKAAVESHGGHVAFVGDTINSSSALINRHVAKRRPELVAFLKGLGLCPPQFRDAVDRLADLKVAIIGEPIRDVYHTVDVLGLTAKASVLSLRHIRTDSYDGGVDAVTNHVRQFTPNVRCTRLLPEPVVKERYVSAASGDQPVTKHFAVQRFPMPGPADASLFESVRKDLEWADVCLVMDFGHGGMTRELRDLVQMCSQFLAVNCQTNSANHGFNVISRRYSRCELFVVDRAELALAAGDPTPDPHLALTELREHLRADYGLLTRGDVDTIAVGSDDVVECPALEARAIDSLGAGDAFFSLAALAGAKRYPLGLITLLGQLAGAQAAGVVGNAVPVSKPRLIEHGCQLLA